MLLKGKGIISSFQREIIQKFGSVTDSSNFFLTGGTALAEFYFSHRLSYDLDFFTSQKELILPFSRSLEEELQKKYEVRVVRRFETFVDFEVSRNKESVKLQLAYDSPFRFFVTEDSDLGVKVNNFHDIIVDKFLAYFGRAEMRDAIDLFFILRENDFWKLSELASQKDSGFDLYWMSVALTRAENFPDELTRWPVEMLLDIDVQQLKKNFSELSKTIIEKISKRNPNRIIEH